MSSERANSPTVKKKSMKKIPDPKNELKKGLTLSNYFSIVGKTMHFVNRVKQQLAYKNILNLSEKHFKIINDNAHSLGSLSELVKFAEI